MAKLNMESQGQGREVQNTGQAINKSIDICPHRCIKNLNYTAQNKYVCMFVNFDLGGYLLQNGIAGLIIEAEI